MLTTQVLINHNAAINYYTENTMTPFSPAMTLPLQLSKTYGRFQKRLDRSMSAHGISFNEFLVLHHLCNAPNQNMSRIALAEAVNLTASGVTRMLNPLEKIHLVSKEANSRDARVSLVKPTETGKEIYQDALVSYENSANTLTEKLTAKQVEVFVELLGKL